MPITVIHCWSAPRSRSTALLYSFEARSSANDTNKDTVALDEPLYRRWLGEKMLASGGGIDRTGRVSRPYADALLRGAPDDDDDDDDNDDDGDDDDDDAWRWERELLGSDERVHRAVKTLAKSGTRDGCIFLKQMAKFSHLFDFETNSETTPTVGADDDIDVDIDAEADSRRERKSEFERFLSEECVELRHRHLLLIRDPASCLGSWMGKSGDVHGDNPHPDEVGITQLLDVYSRATGAAMNRKSGDGDGDGGEGGDEVVVVDSDDLAAHPERTLRELCSALGVEYRDSMLTWRAGPHECDGPWAKWWYHDVRKSDGWNAEETTADDGGVGRTTRRYRTVPPALLPALRMSTPAYDFLRTLTASHRHRRAVTTTPSGRLYEDPRNEHVLVYVGTPSAEGRRGTGRIVPRDMAAISPFDSSVQGGDATWEGVRIYDGRIFHLDHHLDRLFRSARALGFENAHTRSEVTEAIFRVLAANGMRDGAHMRLTLTRGEKCTSSMNPLFNVYGTTLIILPEWKPTEGATTYDNTGGVTLVTASNRRSPPSTLDNRIHHNNMIQNILPKMQANLAGAADAVMLDCEGYVAETNATNLFLVRRDRLLDGGGGTTGAGEDAERSELEGAVLVTPAADACLPGITRETVLLLASELGIPTEVRRVSLSEFYVADEVFTTGTMGELTPVTEIDGRPIGWDDTASGRGVVTELLQRTYKAAVRTRLHWSTEIPPFC